MGFLSRFFGNKEKNVQLTENDIAEAGACPNCWGKQSYDDKFVDYVKDQTKSNINKDKQHQKAFVAQFIETNVTGIHLKREGDHSYCPKCKLKYKRVNSSAT